MSGFTDKEARVLNYIQQEVPLTERPYEAAGERTEIPEKEVISIISSLKERDIIRNIAGIFNGETLGYFLSLVAMEVPEENLERAATEINSHPGVSHNYIRNHRYNVWFTLAEENSDLFDKSLEIIKIKSGAEDCLVLRNEKLFKIGLKLKIGDDDIESNDVNDQNTGSGDQSPVELSGDEIEAVKLLQMDLPVAERPFLLLSESAGGSIGEKELLDAGRKFLYRGLMRRYSAVLRHIKAGYSFNAMTAWKVPDNINMDRDLRCFMEEKAISHLYLRTVYPGRWEYPLFSMIHARSPEELSEIINRLSEDSGLDEHIALNSLRELKKKKVIYFSDKFSEWRNNSYD